MSKCENCDIKELNQLKGLNQDELKGITSSKVSRSIKKGEVLFYKDEHINGIFCVRSGICKISKRSDNGREQIIDLVKGGDLIGERSLINNDATNIQATALDDMRVCFIPRNSLEDSLHNNPSFTLELLKNMTSALRNADSTIVDLGQKSVKQRLAYTLLNLEDNFGTTKNGCINITLTREELANIIGTATENIIRLLSKFKKKKFIDLKAKQIFIINKAELELIIEGGKINE